MATQTSESVIGVFDHPDQAARAIADLKSAGIEPQLIGGASREWSKKFDNVSADGQRTATGGAIWGAVVGGLIGATIGWIASAYFPGAMPFMTGQLLLDIFLGCAAGAAGGALTGPFVALGMAQSSSGEYDRYLKRGKTVVIVQAPHDREHVNKILRNAGAYDESMSTTP